MKRLLSWESKVADALPSRWIVEAYHELPSTMDKAREMISAPALVLTQNQTAGRGRMGKTWESAGKGFYGTYLFEVPLESSALGKLSGLSLVVGVVLVRLLKVLGGEGFLKWPNDLLDAQGKKIAGTLIELVPKGAKTRILVGIGINLELPEGSLFGSVKGVTGKERSASEIAIMISEELEREVKNLAEKGFAPYRKEWESAAVWIGEELKGEKDVPLGVMKGVNEEGALLVENNGSARVIASEEIALVRLR